MISSAAWFNIRVTIRHVIVYKIRHSRRKAVRLSFLSGNWIQTMTSTHVVIVKLQSRAVFLTVTSGYRTVSALRIWDRFRFIGCRICGQTAVLTPVYPSMPKLAVCCTVAFDGVGSHNCVHDWMDGFVSFNCCNLFQEERIPGSCYKYMNLREKYLRFELEV